MRGQYIINIPEKELVIVRTGHQRGKKHADGAQVPEAQEEHTTDLPGYLSIGMNLLNQVNQAPQ